MARLLEPPDVERLDEPREADRVVGRPATVRVHCQNEVGAGGLARGFHTPGVLLGREAANLELAPGHAGPAVGFHLASDVGEGLALHVVSADRDDRQPRAIAAEERAHALAERLTDEIPERAIDAGDRLEQHLSIAAQVTGCEEPLPDAFALEDAHAAGEGRERLADQAHDLSPVLAVVAVVDLADEPKLHAQMVAHACA